MNWAVLSMLASFHLSYTALKGNSGISKIKVLFYGTLSQTPENFALAYRSAERIINLAQQRWTIRVCKLDRRRSTNHL